MRRRCCCGNITTCIECLSGISKCWEIVVAGVSNVSCLNCGNYNGTIKLTYIDSCRWLGPNTDGCVDAGTFCSFALLDNPLWLMNYNVTVSGKWALGAAQNIATYELTSGDPCNNDTLTFSLTNNPGNCCSGLPATITATPISC